MNNNTNQRVEQELPRPIGDFILAQNDIKPAMTENGAYYHYVDVCTMLKRLQQSQSQEQPATEMKWVSEKPELNHHCILIAASFYNGWNYSSFQIDQVEGEDDNGHSVWYWGILDLSGSEWGAYEDIEADLYCIVEIPAPPLNNKDNEQNK